LEVISSIPSRKAHLFSVRSLDGFIQRISRRVWKEHERFFPVFFSFTLRNCSI